MTDFQPRCNDDIKMGKASMEFAGMQEPNRNEQWGGNLMPTLRLEAGSHKFSLEHLVCTWTGELTCGQEIKLSN